MIILYNIYDILYYIINLYIYNIYFIYIRYINKYNFRKILITYILNIILCVTMEINIDKNKLFLIRFVNN